MNFKNLISVLYEDSKKSEDVKAQTFREKGQLEK